MTTAELYDELQEMFGIGDWSQAAKIPWFRARMNEIGKLKRTLRSRHVREDDVYLAAVYAREQQIAITATWELFELIPDAKKHARQPKTDMGLQAAIQDAIAAGDDDWAVRLENVHPNDPTAVAAVLKEYEDR